MKKILFGAILLISAAGAKAQEKNLKLSVGPEIAAVTGNLGDVYSLAIGGTVQADLKINEEFAVTANSGFIDFIGKKIGGTNVKYQSNVLIPLLAGAKYYFSPKAYGSLQLGTTIATNNGGGSTFTYAPGVGYKFDEHIDAILKYTGYSGDGGTFGIRVGYTF
jgi:hypothetical protein